MQYSVGRAPRNLLEASDLFDKGFSKLIGKTVRFKRFFKRYFKYYFKRCFKRCFKPYFTWVYYTQFIEERGKLFISSNI